MTFHDVFGRRRYTAKFRRGRRRGWGRRGMRWRQRRRVAVAVWKSGAGDWPAQPRTDPRHSARLARDPFPSDFWGFPHRSGAISYFISTYDDRFSRPPEKRVNAYQLSRYQPGNRPAQKKAAQFRLFKRDLSTIPAKRVNAYQLSRYQPPCPSSATSSSSASSIFD